MGDLYLFVPDYSLAPGWAFYIQDGEPICFTLDDWADDPDLVTPDVGAIHFYPSDLREMLQSEARGKTRH